MTTARSAGEASPPGDTPGSTPAGHRVRRGTARPRMRRAATGGAFLASWAVLVAWLIASAPPLAPPADAADRGPDALAEVPIADRRSCCRWSLRGPPTRRPSTARQSRSRGRPPSRP